jgi:hypothetical protein
MLIMILYLNIDKPHPQRPTLAVQIKRLDPIGAFLFVPSIVSLILALEWGGTTYSWSAPRIIGLLVTFAVLFVIFIVYESLTPDTAMVPKHIVLNRSIIGSLFFAFLVYGAVMAVTYYIAIWFQAVKGTSATEAGVRTLPFVLGMVVFSILSAKITERIGYYIPSIFVCCILCPTGAGLLSTLTRNSGHSYWIGYQALFGFGVGSGFQASNLPAQTVLSQADAPIGLALQFFMQQLGGSVFLSVGQNIFSQKVVDRLSSVAGINPALIVDTGATDIRKVVPPDALDTVIIAYNDGIAQVFLMAAILCAIMVTGASIIEWRSIKGDRTVESSLKDANVKKDTHNFGTKE